MTKRNGHQDAQAGVYANAARPQPNWRSARALGSALSLCIALASACADAGEASNADGAAEAVSAVDTTASATGAQVAQLVVTPSPAPAAASGKPRRPKLPAGVDPKKLATRPANAVSAGLTLSLGHSPAFGSIVITQANDPGDAAFRWSMVIGGHNLAGLEVDDEETGYKYFVYEGYVSTWDDGTVLNGDLLVRVAPDGSYRVTVYDARWQATYVFDWRPKPPPAFDPKRLATRPPNAVLVSAATVIPYIASISSSLVVRTWDVNDLCYTWTVDVDGDEARCVEIDDPDSGKSYFFYEGYSWAESEGGSVDGDVLISVSADNSYEVNVYDFSQNVTYNFGDEVHNDFGDNVYHEAGGADPGAGAYGGSDPGAGEYGGADPGAGEYGGSDPGAGEYGGADPGAGEYGGSDPGDGEYGAE